jgi:hypothetical protein
MKQSIRLHSDSGRIKRDEHGKSLGARAEERLRRHPHHALRRVICEVESGALVLRGRLPSWYLKQLAQEAVADLEGVDRLENRIEVFRIEQS